MHPSFTFLWFSRKTKSATYLSSSTDKLGCTLLSKRDKPNRCGWLSDLWQGGCQTQQWTVVPVSHRITIPHRYAIFSWFAGRDRQGNPCRRGNPHADDHSKKAAATLYRAAAAVFPQQKTTGSVLADPSVFTSFEQFSWLTHHKLCAAFSGFPNDRLSPCTAASTHTVAVPSGIRTRFSILLRSCYRFHRHSNGIFTCEVSIHEFTVKVNRKKKRP